MKPSWLDDFASDRELELEGKDLYGGTIKENNPMVKMMADLGNESEWLPWREQRKMAARITGKVVHCQASILRSLTSIKGKGSPMPMGPTLLQNQHKCSDAHNTFRQERIKQNLPVLDSKSPHLAHPYHLYHLHLCCGQCPWMYQGCYPWVHLMCRQPHCP